MATYMNPFTDVGFKRIFGQEFSKPLLIDFLNNLFYGQLHIVDLKFLDKEQLGIFDQDRSLIYDVYCELDTEEKTLWKCRIANRAISRAAVSIIFVNPSPAKESRGWNGTIRSRLFT